MDWERIEELVEAARWNERVERLEAAVFMIAMVGLLVFGLWAEGRL